MASVDVLAQRMREFADTSTGTRAPLYSRLASAVADDPEVLRLLQAAPETQQLPVLLFAAVHHLLLGGVGAELAAHYPNLTAAADASDPWPAFRSFALEHADDVTALMAVRHTQTNEIGRCATFLPALGLLGDEVGPLARVDVGASAGLTLLLPRFHYRYEPGGEVGDASTVTLVCGTRGAVPVPASMPRIECSIGIDLQPIDVHDDTEVRWLEACVWPDQSDRFRRLVAAIDLARTEPPDVRRGDAVADVATTVREVAAHGHPVITTSWVLNYLTPSGRRAFVDELDRLGDERDLSWVIAESPRVTPELPIPTTEPPEDITVLSLVRWRHGARTVRRLATAHPHGYWLHWEP